MRCRSNNHYPIDRRRFRLDGINQLVLVLHRSNGNVSSAVTAHLQLISWNNRDYFSVRKDRRSPANREISEIVAIIPDEHGIVVRVATRLLSINYRSRNKQRYRRCYTRRRWRTRLVGSWNAQAGWRQFRLISSMHFIRLRIHVLHCSRFSREIQYCLML